jgi:hypothetical protein
MTYAELNKVNAEIKYLPLDDDSYAPVAERILAFRKLYPEGFILTELSVSPNNENVFHTAVGYYNGDGMQIVLGTGTAREKPYDAVDNISPLERAETASVGRALGMAGFGVKSSICSYEELNYATSSVAGDITAEQPKPKKTRKPKKAVETLEPIIIDEVQSPIDSQFGDTTTGSPIPVPDVDVVSFDTASGSGITYDATANPKYSVEDKPTEKLATEKQKSLISKYYGNKIQDLLDSIGADSIDTISYANAAEIIAQMVSG